MKFEEAIKEQLISTYIEAFGADTWNSKTEEQKSQTLHELLASFLTVARRQ